MDADWLYSAYNHSHPILVERLRALGYKGGENILGDEKKKKANGISE
jgi:STE24 endopeptidase